jgi:hypothetical protein
MTEIMRNSQTLLFTIAIPQLNTFSRMIAIHPRVCNPKKLFYFWAALSSPGCPELVVGLWLLDEQVTCVGLLPLISSTKQLFLLWNYVITLTPIKYLFESREAASKERMIERKRGSFDARSNHTDLP